MDWFDLLAVQRTLKNLLQHHSSKKSILHHLVQLSHPYITTGKAIASNRQDFLVKIMPLLFNTLQVGHSLSSREQASFHFMLHSPSAVILEPPPQIKSVTVSIVSPSICHEVMEPDAMILVFWMFSFVNFFILLFHFHQEAFLHFLP